MFPLEWFLFFSWKRILPSISISYCGGCNEGYSRTAFVSKLLERLNQLPGEPLQIVPADEPANMQLLVCGCMAMCLAHRQPQSPASVCHIVAPDHLDYAYCPQDEIIEKLAHEFTRIKNIA